MIQYLISVFVALWLQTGDVHGFLVVNNPHPPSVVPLAWNHPLEQARALRSSTSLYLAKNKKKGKESMAEKRARRQAKQQRQVDAPPPLEVPVTALTLEEEAETEASPSTPQSTTATAADDDDANAVKTKAQELLDRQKESISVLTAVREAVEAIDEDSLQQALDQQGYYVVDNFLQTPTALFASMQQEAPALYESNLTSLDTTDNSLGFAGEFLTPLQGGEAQYQLAPRSIEWVVGTTKYIPNRIPGLDSGNCMAFLRTFDRSARQAARQLFFGEEGEAANTDEEEPVASPPSVEAPDEGDQRTISLRYYLVDEEWDSSAAGSGGLVFAGTSDTAQHQKVDAQANRLVIYKSKKAVVQKEAWFMGSQDKAHCIELHLIRETAAP